MILHVQHTPAICDENRARIPSKGGLSRYSLYDPVFGFEDNRLTSFSPDPRSQHKAEVAEKGVLQSLSYARDKYAIAELSALYLAIVF